MQTKMFLALVVVITLVTTAATLTAIMLSPAAYASLTPPPGGCSSHNPQNRLCGNPHDGLGPPIPACKADEKTGKFEECREEQQQD